jgi:hypothetical protein
MGTMWGRRTVTGFQETVKEWIVEDRNMGPLFNNKMIVLDTGILRIFVDTSCKLFMQY